MTCTEIIEKAVEDFCNNYCKYPDLWDKGEIEHGEYEELSESEICTNCPINRL